ncbi:hypothetical protein BSL78_10677 [Apostichopus japonicus]|uniref:Mannosyltransferase n=1 Tax=Stichopus japonicus TaxID=307972 RepID=A0A2G8KWP1_STIJA|nr:hypothetical protein BSL78_10677 [Apostichopus japonicus]
MAFKLYCLLLLVRFLWVFQPQPGYIHPDEFFQNPEPLAGDIFGYDVHRTWEFNKTQLTRSVFFPSLTSGISFLVLKTLSEADLLTITPALLLIFPRLAMVLCSLSTDFCIYNISKLLKFNPEKCLNIFASSYIVLVFCSRTFSNSIEVGVYALILLMVVDSRQKQLVPQAQSKKEKGRSLPRRRNPKGRGKVKNITLTPLNFIKYNLDVDNLSSHGIHPQVTHFFVNLPMLCLPLYVSFFTEVFAVYFGKGKASRPTFTSSTSRAFLGLCFFTPVLLISIFPHQEARFVMPAVIPLILLYSEFVTFPNGFPNVPWIAWNLLGCLIFGLLHQAGMIPCLAHINGMLVKQPSAEPVSHHVVFFHTYMPPRHLLMRSLNLKGRASELHIQT